VRERVRQALAGPVAEGEKLLADLQDADADTSLSILVSGWFRGLAAALEELAIAVDDLLARPATETAVSPAPSERNEATPSPPAAAESSERVDLGEADPEQMSEEARKSREETAKLRKEAERDRRRLEH
jgi:ActR/RegA family two-component response regulator